MARWVVDFYPKNCANVRKIQKIKISKLLTVKCFPLQNRPTLLRIERTELINHVVSMATEHVCMDGAGDILSPSPRAAFRDIAGLSRWVKSLLKFENCKKDRSSISGNFQPNWSN